MARACFFLILSVACLLFYSCNWFNSRKTDQQIINSLDKIVNESILKNDKNSFRLDTLTDFNWDALIVFPPYFTVDKLEKDYNIDLTKVKSTGIQSQDKFCVIVFLLKKEVVRVLKIPRTKIDFSNLKARSPFLSRNSKFLVNPKISTGTKTYAEINLLN